MIPPMFGYIQAMITPAPTIIRLRISTWKMLEVEEFGGKKKYKNRQIKTINMRIKFIINIFKFRMS